jgi:hypothetical protein
MDPQYLNSIPCFCVQPHENHLVEGLVGTTARASPTVVATKPRKEFMCSIETSSFWRIVEVVRRYLEEVVPCEFSWSLKSTESGEEWVMDGTIFVEYIPVGVEMCICVSGANIIVTASHASQNDVIRFSRAFHNLVKFLRGEGYQATSNHEAMCCFQLQEFDDDFLSNASDIDEEEPSWDEKVEYLLDNIDSNTGVIGADDLQILARWASSSPDSHEALAERLAWQTGTFSKLLCGKPESNLVEMYLLAATWRSIAEGASPEIFSILLNTPFPTMLDQVADVLPALVVRELTITRQCLLMLNVANTKTQHTHCQWQSDYEDISTRASSLNTIPDVVFHEDDEEDEDDEEQCLTELSVQPDRSLRSYLWSGKNLASP